MSNLIESQLKSRDSVGLSEHFNCTDLLFEYSQNSCFEFFYLEETYMCCCVRVRDWFFSVVHHMNEMNQQVGTYVLPDYAVLHN